MSGLRTFVFAYFLGGITFIPLVIVAFLYLNQKTKPTNDVDDKDLSSNLLVPDIDPELKAGKYEDKEGVDVKYSGWISITNQYYYHFTELKELGLNDDETVLERSQLKKRQRFYVILREGNLFLYKDDDPRRNNLLHAISLKDMFVTIWPRYNTDNEPLPDASLYTKRTCLGLFRKGSVTFDEDKKMLLFAKSNIIEPDETNQDTATLKTSKANQFYLYFENNMDKEDWYFQLINASKNISSTEITSPLNPNIIADTAHLNTADALYLIQTINSTRGQLTTKWLNALLGRLFLSLQETDTLNQVLLEKIDKKLTKINKPGFLNDFVIEKVDVGNSVPFITNPQLSEMSPEGSMKLLADVSYKGSLEVIISTKVNINLGSHFKPREVSLQLSIKVKEVTGPLLILFKPPPSNRIWYAFESEPVMELDIEPIVSSSKLSYNVITNAIKGKFAEAIKESLVVPYYDDIVFYSTTDEIYRGGVWSKNTKTSASSLNMELDMTKTQVNDTDSNKSSNKVETKSNNSSSFKATETSVKSRTIEKMGSLKNSLKPSRLSMDFNTSANSTYRSNDQDEELDIGAAKESKSKELANKLDEHSTKSKKYIKNSMNKLNRWYKENVSTKEDEIPEEEQERLDEMESNEKVEDNLIETIPMPTKDAMKEPPQMISNRRAISKKTNENVLSSPVVSQMSESSEGKFDTSPVVVATEMFGNKQRSISTSSGSHNTINHKGSYSQFTNPNMKEYY
ncbi:similar to Saccharomyces cerevisiae YPR091C Putative protein of unknown function [Maudiozyma saulgeensis]|uniref:SMP-LTD domain-containing protein n=1 Tax=Maudiozyma saulgeensis TaxID=1789683 RepID=A0A1X7QXH6_9SACH|nr:similar to Saccharomyces cerevisiae YPR091C Putative protein of unknown function [Kazachstania saulgeensis]